MTRRLLQIAAWLALAVIIFVTVSPIGLRPRDVMPVNFDRAAAFAVTALLFVIAYPRHWLLAGGLIVIGAGGIELLQELSPTRHANIVDALVKVGGVGVGVLLGRALNKILSRLISDPVYQRSSDIG